MNSETEKKILRQLKFLNFWMALFGTILIGFIIASAFVGYQVFVFVDRTTKQINTFEQNTTEQLNVKKQVCEGGDSFSDFIRNSTDACN